MWNGYLSYDGNEIINIARLEAYASQANVSWFKSTYHADELGEVLGDGPYRSALLDDAPWVDPDNEDSLEFFGLYPIDLSGFEDSTGEASVFESTGNGGVVGKIRYGTRSVVVAGILMASSEAGADYGMKWLKRSLTGSACNAPGDVGGGDLCYMNAEPCLLPISALSGPGLVDQSVADASADVFSRTLRRTKPISGPTITTKKEMSDGGRNWAVQFTLVSDIPFEFGHEVPIIEGFMDPTVTDPFVDGVTGGTYDLNGIIVEGTDCGDAVFSPLYDPLCPALIAPPGPPTIALGCYTPPTNWRRRQITIPKQYIPLWDDVVPVIQVHARIEDVRNLRLRFYADIDGTGDPNEDPCGYCGDIVITYVPVNSTLVFDGASRTVSVIDPGGLTRRADTLVIKTDGTPFDWPELSCGFGYIVAFDLPQTQPAPVVGLSLVPRSI